MAVNIAKIPSSCRESEQMRRDMLAMLELVRSGKVRQAHANGMMWFEVDCRKVTSYQNTVLRELFRAGLACLEVRGLAQVLANGPVDVVTRKQAEFHALETKGIVFETEIYVELVRSGSLIPRFTGLGYPVVRDEKQDDDWNPMTGPPPRGTTHVVWVDGDPHEIR